MSNKIEVKQIVLSRKDDPNPIVLSIEEAKEVYSELKKLFGTSDPIIVEKPIYIEKDKFVPYQPSPYWPPYGTGAQIPCIPPAITWCGIDISDDPTGRDVVVLYSGEEIAG